MQQSCVPCASCTPLPQKFVMGLPRGAVDFDWTAAMGPQWVEISAPNGEWRLGRDATRLPSQPGAWVHGRHSNGGWVCMFCQEHTQLMPEAPATCPACGAAGDSEVITAFRAIRLSAPGTSNFAVYGATPTELRDNIAASGCVSDVRTALKLGAAITKL